MNEEKSLVLSETLVNDLIPNTSLSQESLAKICNRLPELHRAKTAVGRKNSQTTATLMTMTMLPSCNPDLRERSYNTDKHSMPPREPAERCQLGTLL